MNGQVEGLEIGGEAIGLWNYREAHGIQVLSFDMGLYETNVQKCAIKVEHNLFFQLGCETKK